MIAYILLVGTFFGWGLFHRTREGSIPSSLEPLMKSTNGSGEDENLSLKVYLHYCFTSYYILNFDKIGLNF